MLLFKKSKRPVSGFHNLRCQRADDKNYEWAIALRDDGTMTMANMGGNAEYSYISWMDLRRS